jgi:pimeloyl-ACP methyl ester carboxylesterase
VRYTSGSFYLTKRPARIQQVLKQVYIDHKNVDEELVKSIALAADHPNAADVFVRIIEGTTSTQTPLYVDDLLRDMRRPLMLIWGDLVRLITIGRGRPDCRPCQDPWIRPMAAEKIQQLFPSAVRVSVAAGHCPHDEAPEVVNAHIAQFAQTIFTPPL